MYRILSKLVFEGSLYTVYFITNYMKQLWSHLNKDHTPQKCCPIVLLPLVGDSHFWSKSECLLPSLIHICNFLEIFSDLAVWMQRFQVFPELHDLSGSFGSLVTAGVPILMPHYYLEASLCPALAWTTIGLSFP